MLRLLASDLCCIYIALLKGSQKMAEDYKLSAASLEGTLVILYFDHPHNTKPNKFCKLIHA